jgi:aryl-alcohol dehydrogenase-like predicted oxidoreductase
MTLPDFQWLRERLENSEGREQVRKAGLLAAIALELGLTSSQMAIGWCLRNPRVSTVVLGASSPSQLSENLTALDVPPKLTPEVLSAIEAVVANRPPDPERF